MADDGIRAVALRWGAIGIALNGVLFLAYLGLTDLGLGPAGAMTTTYAIGLFAGFALHRGWSFRHRGAGGPALRRHLALHALGYGGNLLALRIAVDGFGAPHAIVQAVAIPALALFFFLAQRFWVFAPVPQR